MQKDNKFLKVFSITSCVVFSLSIFLLGGKNVSAQTYVQKLPTIESTGGVGGSIYCSGTAPTGYGFRLYGGAFPATTTLIESDNGNSVCTDGGNFGYFPTIQASWQNLESGYVTLNPITTDGTYWIAIAISGTAFSPDWNGTIWYFRATRQGGIWYPPGTLPELNIATPVDSFSYSSNPITFGGTYSNPSSYDQIQLDIQNTSLNQTLLPTIVNLPAINAIDQPWSIQKNLPFQGAYTVSGRLWDSVNATGTLWTTDITFLFGSTGTTSTTTQSNLPGTPTPIDCGTFDIGCYIKNGFVWLFYPDSETVTKFQSLTLENSFPFSYAYEILDLREELFNATSTATTTVSVNIHNFGKAGTSTITFLSKAMLENVPFASTVKTILGWILYLLAAEYIYYRLLKSHDK